MKKETQVYVKGIYAKEVIESAIFDYKRIATIELMENQTHYICSFKNCVVDAQRVICEFNNYLIELMNTQERQ